MDIVQKIRVVPSDIDGCVVIEQCMPESMGSMVYVYEVPREHVDVVIAELKDMFEQTVSKIVREELKVDEDEK